MFIDFDSMFNNDQIKILYEVYNKNIKNKISDLKLFPSLFID